MFAGQKTHISTCVYDGCVIIADEEEKYTLAMTPSAALELSIRLGRASNLALDCSVTAILDN
jgi:hypothetical protein